MQKQAFSGLGVALVTPMRNGQVDFSALAQLTTNVIEGGVDYLVVLGTTGESVTLNPKECRMVFDCVLNVNAGRKKVIAGFFGENNTALVVKRLREFNFDGFDGILSSSPAYIKPSQEGIYRHYVIIAEQSPVPVILYNVPGRTASNILPETTLRLAEHENIWATKEAKGDIVQASEIIKHAPSNFSVLSGDDPTALGLMACGGHGLISVIGNAFPKLTADMIHAAQDGDYTTATRNHLAMLDFHGPLYADGNPAGIKGLLQLMGLGTDQVRMPLVSLQKSTLAQLKKALADLKSSKPASQLLG